MMSCYRCRSKKIVKNGRHQNGKQNYKCRDCCRQFVENAHHITDETKNTIRKLLLEKLSLRGICRATGVSLSWLTQFLRAEAQKVSANSNAKVVGQDPEVRVLGLEVDEMWTFAKKKDNLFFMDPARHGAEDQANSCLPPRRLIEAELSNIVAEAPRRVEKRALFHTDNFLDYDDVIPFRQHIHKGIQGAITQHLERFHCTLRQRISCLVRKTLSFAKSLIHLESKLLCFISDYNTRLSFNF